MTKELISRVAEIKEKLDRVKKAQEINTLTPREIYVIEMRFGLLEDKTMHTLEETAEFFGVTRERIRQLQAKALEKLRLIK